MVYIPGECIYTVVKLRYLKVKIGNPRIMNLMLSELLVNLYGS